MRVGPLPESTQSLPLLPLLIEPESPAERSAVNLAGWLVAERAAIAGKLIEHGALLFRGFAIDDPAAFERVARAVDAELKNDYLGTSPRDALTDYVFSASELPPYYPIPQHIEMSFTRHPPRHLFFCCLLPNPGAGGETPLCDFRRVHRDLAPAVRERFEERGVRNIRNYCGPEGGSRFDLWKLKRWDEMFRTTERAAVERACAENGFDAAWTGAGRLRLTNRQPAMRPHPSTGEPVWFNHSQIFHLSSVPAEYQLIARRQKRLKFRVLAEVARLLVAAKRSLTPVEEQAMHCTFGDGTPISDEDMDAVRAAIWRNMVFVPWQKGDVVAIDNASVSHGRMPYEGPRKIAVCWA